MFSHKIFTNLSYFVYILYMYLIYLGIVCNQTIEPSCLLLYRAKQLEKILLHDKGYFGQIIVECHYLVQFIIQCAFAPNLVYQL